MGIKATVEPHVVAGTDRGGEDLYLLFSAHEDDTVEGVLLELEDGDEVWNWEYEDEEAEEDCDDEHEGKVYFCTTSQYKFKWEGTHKDLLKLFVENGGTDTNCWSWYGPVSEPPKKRFILKFYVDGNAE